MFKTFAAALLAASVSAADGYDYDYTDNGANWTTLVELCGTGTEQSPIDLTSATPTESVVLSAADYFDVTVSENFEENGVKQVDGLGDVDEEDENAVAPVLTLTDGSGAQYTFNPVQFHFHAPSEHSVDGQLHDAEVHFVHTQTDSGALFAVIGMIFSQSVGGTEDNEFLTSLFNAIDTRTGEDASGADVEPSEVAVLDFLGSQDLEDFWSYDGSFTTPPCTEGVKWSVMKKIQPISDAQLARFTQYLADDASFANGNGNNRVVQPLNDRTLWEKSVASSNDDTSGDDDSAADGANALVTGAAAIAAIAALSF